MPGVNLPNVWTGQTGRITIFYESWYYQIRYFFKLTMWLIISLTLFSSSKYSYLTWKGFFTWSWSLLLLLWNFYILAMNGYLGESIWWNSIYPENVLFSYEVELIYSCTFICTTKQPGWPFDRDCQHCYSAFCSSFLFKANHFCSQKQVAKFITII